MDKDKINFSERQVKILEDIGRKYRPMLKKDIKNLSIVFFVIYLLLLSVLFWLSNQGDKNFVIAIVLGILSLGVLLLNWFLYRNKLKKLLKADDFTVGLHYRYKDPRIFGNAVKAKSHVMPAFWILGILYLFCSLGLGIINLTTVKLDYNQLIYQTKIVETVSDFEDEIIFTFVGDNHDYIISSIYFDYIDTDSLILNVLPTDTVQIGYKTLLDDKMTAIYFFSSEDIIYMDEAIFDQGYEANQRIADIIFIVCTSITISCLVGGLSYYYLVYKKRLEKEEISFEKTEEEIQTFQELNPVESEIKPLDFELKVSDVTKLISITLSIVFTIILIISIRDVSASDKLFVGIIASLFALVFWRWTIACFYNRDVIRDGIYIKKRFLGTKQVELKEIKMIKSYTNNIGILSFEIIGFDNSVIFWAISVDKKNEVLLDAFKNSGVHIEQS